MTDHAEKAKDYFRQGYNCAQAVLLAFGDETGLDPDTAAKLSSSFGGGLGRLREVCGAVSGMSMAAGLIAGYSDPKARTEKAAHYARIQQLAAAFRAENGSIVCRELLGNAGKDTAPAPEARTEAYYRKRPCVELVGQAAHILEEALREELPSVKSPCTQPPCTAPSAEPSRNERPAEPLCADPPAEKE